MRKSKRNRNPLWLTLFLIVCLCAMGTAYAAWTQPLKVMQSLKSGNFSIEFDSKEDIQFSIVRIDYDDNEIEIEKSERIKRNNIEFENDNKSVKIKLDNELMAKDLTASNDRVIMLNYPIMVDANSSVDSIFPLKADFKSDSKETLEVIPLSLKISVDNNDVLIVKKEDPQQVVDNYDDLNISNKNIVLDEDAQNEILAMLNVPLEFETYRQIEAVEDKKIGTIFLKPKSSSINRLEKEISITLSYDDLINNTQVDRDSIITNGDSTGNCSARISIEYLFSIPLIVEQSR